MKLSAKQIFLGGFVIGVLASATAGFLFMTATGSNLASLFKGSLDRNTAQAADQPSAAAPTAAAPTNPGTPPAGPVPPLTKDDHVRGDANAPVTVVEYSDFQCPFCQRFHPVLQQVMKDYAGKVKWVYRYFPLTSIHPYAEKSAEAAQCASDQGKFWEMADALFGTQDKWTNTGLDTATLEGIARQAGVSDLKKFDDCVASGTYAKMVASEEAGGETAGVTGTPGSFVIGKSGQPQLIPGALPIDAVKQMIDAALKG